MSAGAYCGAILGGIAAFMAAGAALFYSSEDDDSFGGVMGEEQFIDWEGVFKGNDVEPMTPTFNLYDNDECRNLVQEFYQSARDMYFGHIKDEASMTRSYDEILVA